MGRWGFGANGGEGMVTVYLEPWQAALMGQAAERSRDRECCGLLLGTRWGGADPSGDDRAVRVWAVEPMENIWDQGGAAVWDGREPLGDQGDGGLTFGDRSPGEDNSPAHGSHDRYALDPAQMVAAARRARDRGWAIVGIYHSHPNGHAVPSECDRQWAWGEYVYAIVAVADGRATDLRFWQLDERRRFQPLPVKYEGAE